MIIALAQGLAKAHAIVCDILTDEAASVSLLNDAISTPLVPVTTPNIAITYFPMGSVFSIACDPDYLRNVTEYGYDWVTSLEGSK